MVGYPYICQSGSEDCEDMLDMLDRLPIRSPHQTITLRLTRTLARTMAISHENIVCRSHIGIGIIWRGTGLGSTIPGAGVEYLEHTDSTTATDIIWIDG